MKMVTYKDTKKAKRKDDKTLEYAIGVIIIVIGIIALLMQISNDCKSNFDNKILTDSLSMNTKLLDSFRYKLNAFNSEYDSLTGICKTPMGSSITFSNLTQLDDRESVLYGFYKLGLLSCTDFLLQFSQHDSEAYVNTYYEAVTLNKEILNRKEIGSTCHEKLSSWGYKIQIVFFIFAIFLYFIQMRRK